MKIELGMKFGSLVVVKFTKGGSPRFRSMCICRCDCGNTKTVLDFNLKNGSTKSCGCMKCDALSAKATTHGLANHPLYIVWNRMKSRCKSRDPAKAKTYLNRGITVCTEWDDFKNFYDDMIETWVPGLTIDRIDNNLGYSRSNCRWASLKEQARNTTRNRFLEHNGIVKTAIEWSEIYKISYPSLLTRLNKGWSVYKSLTTPVRQITK